ncbi:MAG: hypothetical protein ACTJHM_07105, partial [Agrococcus casei]
ERFATLDAMTAFALQHQAHLEVLEHSDSALSTVAKDLHYSSTANLLQHGKRPTGRFRGTAGSEARDRVQSTETIRQDRFPTQGTERRLPHLRDRRMRNPVSLRKRPTGRFRGTAGSEARNLAQSTEMIRQDRFPIKCTSTT